MATPPVDTEESARESYPGTPRWVIAIAVLAILAIIVIALVLSTGLGGSHGPQRHGPGDEAGLSVTPSPAHAFADHEAVLAGRP